MKKIFLYLSVLLFLYSCDNIIEKNTFVNVFEVFWRTMDENYPFFEKKGVDWDSIYDIYSQKARMARDDIDIFHIFYNILPLFQDGHLWVLCDSGIQIRSIPSCILSGLRKDNSVDMLLANGFEIKHSEEQILLLQNREKRIAYFKLNTFDYRRNNMSVLQPENLLKNLDFSNGLIIDLSDNGGGLRSHSNNFVSAFFTDRKVIRYIQEKTGRGRNDFGEKTPIVMQGKGYVPYNIPVVILTSNNTYSAANNTVYMLTDLRNCTVIGRATSGGGGAQGTTVLPNGWLFGFPVDKNFSPSGRTMEFPFEPDIYVEVEDEREFRDTMLLAALEYLENLLR